MSRDDITYLFPLVQGMFTLSLHRLEIGLVNMGLLLFILGVCCSDAGMDFTASILCPEVSKVALRKSLEN